VKFYADFKTLSKAKNTKCEKGYIKKTKNALIAP
jgi:hypothetical protein